jgi:phosphatidylglycerophosphatase C
MALARYREACAHYGQQVYGPILRADAVSAVAAHQAAGHRVVLVSASLEDYLVELADQIGADDVVATQVAVAGGALTGALAGPNCWGPQKVARLREAFPGAALVAAYGDSRGDRELLEAARSDGGQGHLRLFKDAPARRKSALRRLRKKLRQA